LSKLVESVFYAGQSLELIGKVAQNIVKFHQDFEIADLDKSEGTS